MPPTIISGPKSPETSDKRLEARDQISDWTEEDYELVKWQLIWLHSISFAVAAVVNIALFIIYNNEPHGAPNKCRMLNISKA